MNFGAVEIDGNTHTLTEVAPPTHRDPTASPLMQYGESQDGNASSNETKDGVDLEDTCLGETCAEEIERDCVHPNNGLYDRKSGTTFDLSRLVGRAEIL